MAKSKKYISSKVKRKFAGGGPYKDVEAELYNPNADRTIYQAADQPSTILQQQQEAMLQQQAAANKSMYQNQLNAELAKNQAQQQQTANLIEEEKAARKSEEQKQKQALATQATKGATKLGKQAIKDFAVNPDGKFINAALQSGSYYSPTWAPTTAAPTAPITAAPIVGTESVGTGALTGSIAPAGAVEVGQNLATTTSTGADVAGKAASGASLGTAAAGIGLGLAGEGIGMYATYKQRKEDDAAKRSQYYRDADYTRREALGQIGKSTLKGAGIGVGAGTTLGLGVGSVPAAVVGGVIGGIAGLGYGVGKALHEERLTKSEADRGIKIGNKRFGKKLLFGDENVYSAAKDPYEIAKAQYQDSLEKQAQLASAMDTAALASRTTEANTGFNIKGDNMAKYGGSIEYLKGGVAKPLPRGAKEYVGKKHEQGGIDLPGNIEVEGGETEQNNYIFSATLKLPTGLTYAQAHKNLLASGASSEEIKQLALSQETAAGRNPNKIKTMKFAKYGGPLKYDKGGDTSEIQYAGIDPENTNPSGTVTYTTSDKAVTNKTPTGKPRFFMGASRIVDENGNVQIITDKPLMGQGNMAGSRLGTTTEQGLEDVRTNSYEQAARLKINADYTDVEEATSGKLSSSNAVNDREKIAGTEWGKRWGYKPGMSAAEAKSAHDAFASEMRTKFDQSPDEMLGYYQYLIDNPTEFGKDAEQIKANLKTKGYIGEDGKIKRDALSYLKTQATNEFVGPIHNAAGAYTLKGKPTINKIVEDTPPPGPVETPKRDYTMELPPPPKYIPTKSTNNIGLLQTIPAAFAMGRPINVSPISPTLASGYVQAGSIGRVNLGRVQMNAERAANQQNAAAINQALQNMSGPGAIAGMVAAKTKADQQNLAIAQAEQNANVGLAAKEQELNTGISKFNVGSTMQAQTTNAGIAQQNAARIQQANQFNEQLKYTKNVENRDQMLSALDRGTAAIVQNNLANRQLDATERLASIYDAYNAYNRYLEASQKEPEKKKFGGVKKYVSRLGDLKNVKYKV